MLAMQEMLIKDLPDILRKTELDLQDKINQ